MNTNKHESGESHKIGVFLLVVFLCICASVRAETNTAPSASAPGEAAQLAVEVEDSLRALAQDKFTVESVEASGKAIEAAVRTQDPAARLLTPEQAAQVREDAAGRVFGLGVRFALSNAQPVVAEAAGDWQVGDRLRSVDGQATTNLTLVQLLALVRAETATPVRLTFQRGAATLTSEVARVPLTLSAVETAEKWPRDLAYLKLNGLFTNDGGRAVVAVLRGWAETGRYGFVLDLRDAGGDDLISVDTIGSLFAPAGALLYNLRDREDQDVSVHKALSGDPLDTPVVVLVDGRTRGAAEALAAVLSDSVRGALLVGTPTAGDPLIRDIVELPGGRLIYLARRQLVTAGGGVLDGRAGLIPDVLSTNAPAPSDFYEPEAWPDRRTTGEAEREDRALRDRVRGDIPLRQAVDLLIGFKALNLRAGGVSSN